MIQSLDLVCKEKNLQKLQEAYSVYFHKKEFTDTHRKFQILWIFVRNKIS